MYPIDDVCEVFSNFVLCLVVFISWSNGVTVFIPTEMANVIEHNYSSRPARLLNSGTYVLAK